MEGRAISARLSTENRVTPASRARTVAFKSLGCKLNQYEVQALREGFLKHGFAEVAATESADFYVLNTCTVTRGADADARSLVRVFRRLNPSAEIIVTGCYATADPDAVRTLEGVTWVEPNESKNRILYKVTGLEETSEEESPFFENGISYFEDRSRAFVKIQDGCNYFCAFCKIPYVRGRLVSRDEGRIADEIARLVDYGYAEIVLSGVCLGSYGRDSGSALNLAGLIRRIAGIPGRFRLRLSSIDPRDTPLELAELMTGDSRLAPHLHLSLQSGDDGVLGRMKRGYISARFEELAEAIRRIMPSIGLTTDLIVGFPGEDEAAFERTREFLGRIGFHRVHVFPYSERPGTRAAVLPNKVMRAVIRDRSERLKTFLEGVTRRVLESVVGRTLEVLVESRSRDGLLEGFSGEYYRCAFTGGDELKGSLCRVRVTGVLDGVLLAELAP